MTGTLSLGRAPDNDLVLADRAVSRQHALIEARRDGSLWLTDLGSRGGTQRNRRTVVPRHPLRLEAGDVVAIGPWRWMVDLEGNTPAIALHQAELGETVVAPVETSSTLAEQRLKLVLDFAARQPSLSRVDDLLALLCEVALLGSGYRRSALVSRPESTTPRILCRRPEPMPDDAPMRLSASLLDAALGQDMAVLESPSQTRLKQSLLDAELKRALCLRLPGEHDPPLLLYLDADFMDSAVHADAPALCHALARLAGLGLGAIAEREREQRRLALEAELEAAREIQARIAPARHGMVGNLAYAVLMQPGGAVAGDLADVFELEDGRLAVVLGDVSGSGLGAGLTMASVQAFLRATLNFECDPAAVLSRLNGHLLRQSAGGRFVTLWLGVFDGEGRGRYVDAGHGHALCFNADVGPLRSEGGIPLAVSPEPGYRSEAITLDPQQGLLLYSDGVVEQDSVRGDAFGVDGLIAASEPALSPAPMLLRVMAALDRHRGDAAQEDDVTLLVLRHTD